MIKKICVISIRCASFVRRIIYFGNKKLEFGEKITLYSQIILEIAKLTYLIINTTNVLINCNPIKNGE